MSKKKTDLNAITFEEAMTALGAIVERLESGSCPLHESIELYEQGMHLKKICEKRLKDAELRIQVLDDASESE